MIFGMAGRAHTNCLPKGPIEQSQFTKYTAAVERQMKSPAK